MGPERGTTESLIYFFDAVAARFMKKKFNLDRSHKNVFLENAKIVAHRHTLDLLSNVLGKWVRKRVICIDERGRSKYEMFINISATL